MFSSDHNIALTLRLLKDARQYARLRLQWAQLALVDKLTVVLTFVVTGAVVCIFLTLALALLSGMFVMLLAPHVGGVAMALALMALLYLAAALVVWLKRRAWVAEPIANFLVHLTEDALQGSEGKEVPQAPKP